MGTQRGPKPTPDEQPSPGQSVRDITLPATDPTSNPDPAEQGDTVEDRTSKVPPYYIALQPLFLGDQFSRAHNVGDHVPADHVEAYGWADKVRHPNDPSPQQPAAPHTEPETTPGQATKEGDA
ncbi:hypothetical protein [Streptosporangium roseum]|uniref:hypothetical protein n=1 Tax=Streptosporangium roseum TaxID=2001 RepID=UPI0004CD26D4|nr:hypothetical protein [Streptosporangium roseum]